jgi:tight adherence protein C
MESILLPIIIVVGLAILAGMVYIGLRDDRNRNPLQERLAQYDERDVPESLEEIELSLSFRDRILIPFLRQIGNLTIRFTPEKQIQESRRMIELAGMASSLEPTTLFAIRIIATLFFSIGSIIIFFVVNNSTPPMQALLYVALATALGNRLPTIWISSKIKNRQNGIVKALPDALDLLMICVDAGLGFDSAMGKVYEKWDNDLAIAFGRVLREIQLGRSRREALKDMSNRMDVPDVTSFTAAIIQADSLGVSIATVLRVQADQMRVKRRQRAQEKAQKAPVKMMLPMVFLIFPSMFIVLLGPAAIILVSMGGLPGGS